MSRFFAVEAETMAGMGELIAIAGDHVKEGPGMPRIGEEVRTILIRLDRTGAFRYA
jgi:hypothetical protein